MNQESMLSDGFGRRFEYLRLSITDLCNFRCNYCLPDGVDCSTNKDFLSTQEIKILIEAFARLGTKKIRITGGEPGLRKDLDEIIAMCANTPGIEQVGLTTNGFNLQRNIDNWYASGLTNLNVSADSLDPRMFNAITGHDKLQKVLDGVMRASSLGLNNIKLNAVLLNSFNYHQLDDYLEWLKNKPVTVRFIELMETGDNKSFFKKNHVSGETIKRKLIANGWTQIIRDKLSGPAQEFYHPDYEGKIGLIMPYSKDFCQSCNRLRVSSSGQLHLCLFAELGIDLRPLLKAGKVEPVCDALIAAMSNKAASHELQHHFTGATQHLASLGG
jgi:cyclic pyranopterin phosphate synthase